MEARPLIVTADESFLDDLLRVAAAAGAEVTHEREPGRSASWRSASVVILDAALIGAAVVAGHPHRAGVVVVSRSTPAPEVWEQCVRLGAERTLVLDDGEQALIDALGRDSSRAPQRGPVLAVVGACGGAGASVLSTALAITATRRGHRAVLADFDGWGAGLDVILGVEREPGARWDDLVASTGRLQTAALHAALPAARIGDRQLGVLAFDRVRSTALPVPTADAVLDCLSDAGEVIVADVARAPSPAGDRVLERAQHCVVVVPAEVSACFGAGRVLRRLADLGVDARLVVRGSAVAADLGPDDIAAVLGSPVVAAVRFQAAITRGLERGRPPGLDPRGALARAAGAVLDALPIRLAGPG